MYKSISLAKATLLTSILILGTSITSMATTYSAVISGNWSSGLTWGGTAPVFNVSGADNVVIPVGVTVTQDADVTLSNAASTLSVAGTLTGSNNLYLTSGTLSGAGSVVVNSLTVGTGGTITSLGTINASILANSQASLAITAIMSISNTVVLNAGAVALSTGGVLNLANNVTINMAGGTYSAAGGLPTLAGSFNLLYTGNVSAVGSEAALTGLKNVTVNLASSSSQLSLAAPLTITGVLSLQQGALKLSGNTLTIAGGVTTTAGTISGSTTSNLIVNGTGSIGTIAFTSGSQMLRDLTVSIAGSGNVSLASDLAVNGITTLSSGSLNLNGHNLTVVGTIAAAGLGTITGSATSAVTVNGAGATGTLLFSVSGNTLGSLTLNNTGSAGGVILGSDLTVANMLTLSSGSLNLNGNNLTIGGTINSSGTGSISGGLLSNITFNGSGNSGTLALTPLNQTINNLTLNIGSSGSVALGSGLTVGGTLTLAQGNLDIAKHDLTVAATGSITGGSSASYIMTTDTGRLIMSVANAGANGLFQVGTMSNYAPVTVTNNSTLMGNFMVQAHPGVYLNGTTGADISTAQGVVNTSWNVESSISTGANIDLKLEWNTAMQVNGFDNTQAFISHYTAGAWNTSAVSAATVLSGSSYSMSLTGVTSFSPFGVFGKNVTLGVSAVSNDMLSVYPNPASDRLTIQTGSTDKTNVEISDLSGQIVARYELSGTDNTIGIAGLSTGSYFIKVSSNATSSVKKFVKI